MEAFLIKTNKTCLLAYLGGVWFWPGYSREPVYLKSFQRDVTTRQLLLCQNTLWGACTCCWPRIVYNCVASPFSVSFSRLKTPLKITKQREQVLWGREDVAKWIEHTHPSVSQDWAKMVHAFTTRKQTAGFYNWNVGLSSHLSKSEALELGDKMNIMILQPICPLQLQFFMTSIQSVN